MLASRLRSSAICVAFLAALFIAPTVATSQTGIDVPELAACEGLISEFMAKEGIPGLSFALAREGRTVYSRGFGKADLARSEDTQPYHMFRLGSIGKSITSIALYRLIEAGALSLDDKVFGRGGLLEHHPDLAAANISDERIYGITVEMLLTHTAGWDGRFACTPDPTSPYPWHAEYCEPLFFPLHVTEVLGLPNPVTQEAILTFDLERGLDYYPGAQWRYWNDGYLAIGEIIEMLSGMPYAEFVQTEILHPLGIYDMHIGRSLYEDKRVREVEYNGFGEIWPSSYGDGKLVPAEYGGWNQEVISAAGGWIATAQDLLKLLTAVDGFATKPDILSASSHASMTEPWEPRRTYAKGWWVNNRHDQWHWGLAQGTETLWLSRHDGYALVILLNSAKSDFAFQQRIYGLGEACIAATSTWPTHDLMASPRIAASDISVLDEVDGLEVGWIRGDGERRIVTVSAASAPDAFPLDGTAYDANALFGAGSDLGGGSYVAFDGSGDRVTVSGLTPGEKYRFRVFEYNQNADTGGHALYLLGNHPEASAISSLPVMIDVVSSVKIGKRGVIPVVIFGSDSLEVADLDVTSLRFGSNRAATAHDLTDASTWNEHLQDVNGDGFLDLMTHYRATESGIAPGDAFADIVGQMLDGRPLKGSGSIQTLSR